MPTKKLTMLLGPAGIALALLVTLLSAYSGVMAAMPIVQLDQRPTYTVTGKITFLDNGAPVSDVVVVSSAAITAKTNADGLYKLVGLPPGAHILTPTYYDPNIIYEFEPSSQTVVVPSMTLSQHFTVATVIAVDYGIFGQVTDGDGMAIEDVQVSLNDLATTTTDVDGDFHFFPVMPGEYELLAAKSGYTFLPAKRKALVPGNHFAQDFVGFTRKRVYMPVIRQ